MKYRVLPKGKGLTYPTDSRILKRLAAGEKIPLGKRGMCEPHAIGDIVTDVPSVSAAGLVKAGWIEPVEEPTEEVTP